MSHNNLYDNAKPTRDKNESVYRNNFAVSHRHRGSYGIGKWYPVFTRMLQPNETLHVDPYVDLELDPFMHKLFNGMTAVFRWYKVPLRILQTNFKKMYATPIGVPSDVVNPYLVLSDKPRKGDLLDHLGIPVVCHSKKPSWHFQPIRKYTDDVAFDGSGSPVSLNSYVPCLYRNLDFGLPTDIEGKIGNVPCAMPIWMGSATVPTADEMASKYDSLLHLLQVGLANRSTADYQRDAICWMTSTPLPRNLQKAEGSNGYNFQVKRAFDVNISSSGAASGIRLFFYQGDSWASARYLTSCDILMAATSFSSNKLDIQLDAEHPATTIRTGYICYRIPDETVEFLNLAQNNGSIFIVGTRLTPISPASVATPRKALLQHCPLSLYGGGTVDSKEAYSVTPGIYDDYGVLVKNEVTSGDTSCFMGADASRRLNAWFARAYRACYNADLRDKVLDPFCPAVNPHDASNSTTPYMDRCVENMDDGPDIDTPLVLERCSWSEDIFNGSLPTPNMVTDRPLVGVRVNDSSLMTADLNYTTHSASGSGDSGVITLSYDANHKVTGIQKYENFDANNITLDTLNDMITVGICLEDLKTAKALTEWAVTNYKQGRFSWRQYVGAHYGTYPDGVEENFPTLLMTDTVKLNEWEVINSALTDASPLGVRGAMGNIQGGHKQVVVYANEPCIVMGLMAITIDNCNVDALSRQFYTFEREDFPDPKFSTIGMQPILNREVAPLLCKTPQQALGIMGYNGQYRWMTESHDTIAGVYNSEKSNEMMVRLLNGLPELGVEYKTINSDELTNPFAGGKITDDHIFGSFFFKSVLTTWLPQRPVQQVM